MKPGILARDEIHQWVIRALSEEPRGILLDAPAGTGALALRLVEMGYSVSCLDINPASFQAQGLEFKACDLSLPLPYLSESFDYVTCLEGLEHLENPFNAIREFHRILKSGGRIYLSVPNYLNIERRMRFLITGIFSRVPSPKRLGKERFQDLSMLHLTPLTYPILKLFMEHTGFKILRIAKDKEKKRMKWLLPVVWGIKFYCLFWSRKKRMDYQLRDTLSPVLIMGGNTLIIAATKA